MKACFYIDECSLSYAKLVQKHERTKKFSFVFQKTAQYALYQPHTFLRSKPRFHRFSNKTSLHHKQALFTLQTRLVCRTPAFTPVFIPATLTVYKRNSISLQRIRTKTRWIKISTEGGHEKWKKEGCLRSIILQTHIDPVPEFIVKNNLRTLGLTRKDFIEWLKLSHTKN